AAGAAAEAVVELLVRADREGRSLFLVERAAGAVVAAGLLQGHALAHHLDDIGAVEQVVDEGLRDQSCHGVLAGEGRLAAGTNAKNPNALLRRVSCCREAIGNRPGQKPGVRSAVCRSISTGERRGAVRAALSWRDA